MDTILEEQRSLHEERDRIEMAIVGEMLTKKSGQREKLDSEHNQRALFDRYMKCSASLADIYEKQFKIPLSKTLDTNPFANFYLKIKKINDFYEKHPNEQLIPMAAEFEEMEAERMMEERDAKKNHQGEDSFGSDSDDSDGPKRDEEVMKLSKGLPTIDVVETPIELPKAPQAEALKFEKQIEFTDEEGYGKYLDLVKCHESFLQLFKNESSKPDYITYLHSLDNPCFLSREKRLCNAYKNYLEQTIDYFRSYIKRAKPLLVHEGIEKETEEEFEEKWGRKDLKGWFSEADQLTEANDEYQIDLEQLDSRDELLAMGLECLKKELQVRKLKCGGTLDQRAERLWSVRGKKYEDIDDSIKVGDIALDSKKSGKRKKNKSLHRDATIENVQRRQARTAEERDIESDEDISDSNDEDDIQTDLVYNPKNLPLGWDGKPIPYWLYKLHGLNLAFTCEICGNATYKGPKAFQRHFAEWRHAQGMRALGIPNTAHFANITQIDEATNLWEKLNEERRKEQFDEESEEECEDAQGNVFKKKTFESLKKQGLI